jgi:hypothetical protein
MTYGWAIPAGVAMVGAIFAMPQILASVSSRKWVDRVYDDAGAPQSPASGVLWSPADARAMFGPLSESIAWEDAWSASRTTDGIPVDVANRMVRLARRVLQRIDDAHGPIAISSWYRPGSTLPDGRLSCHDRGTCADLRLAGRVGGERGALRAAAALRAAGARFDRVLGYDASRSKPPGAAGDEGHVHVSEVKADGTRAGTVLFAPPGGGWTTIG